MLDSLNPEILRDIFITKMPFGKYANRAVADLPVHYLEWFAAKGFPKGKLGMMMATVYEIKHNGLDELLPKLRKQFEHDTTSN